MRRLLIGTTVLVLAAGWWAPASAAAPTRVSVVIQAEFEDEELSDACGFQVLISASGSLFAMLHQSGSGGSTLEIDKQVVRWTYEAPANGTSFSCVNSLTAIFEYPDGIDVGDRATVTILGTFEHIAGSPASGGRTVFESTIDHVGADGFPVAFLGESTIQRGSAPGETDPCAA